MLVKRGIFILQNSTQKLKELDLDINIDQSKKHTVFFLSKKKKKSDNEMFSRIWLCGLKTIIDIIHETHVF